jgi:hypothetical protein
MTGRAVVAAAPAGASGPSRIAVALACAAGFALAAGAGLGACGGPSELAGDEAAALKPPADAIAKVAEQGPVKATLRVWPAKPTLGDPIHVRLEIESPPGISVDAPFQEAGDQRLGRFRVVAFDRGTEHKPGGGQLQEQTYTLEAYSSGRHRIPPLRLEMIDARAGSPAAAAAAPAAGSAAGSGALGSGAAAGSATAADPKAKPQELLTDEIPLDIAPVKAEAANADLKPPRGALDARVGGTSPLAVLGAASALLVLGAGGLLLWRALRARRRIQQQRSAYDDAVSALRALEDRGAPDVDAADAWFVELSSIARRYLEQRYEIRAPELTTEEFLQVAIARPELREDHRGLLTSFLERCDRVKFAGYRPDAQESLATLAAARGFVEDTRLRLAPGAAP